MDTNTENKRHELALYLHREADRRAHIDVARQLAALARQADGEPWQDPRRFDALLAVVDTLRTLAEGMAALQEYTTIELHDAQQHALALRNDASDDWATMRRHDAQARMLGNVIARRTYDRQAVIAPERATIIHDPLFDTRQDTLNYRRRQKRQRLV